MKAVKLSLAAALVASSAFAIDLGSLKDVKVTGQFKAWYETTENEATSTGNLFSQGTARGQAMAKVGMTGNLGEKVGFGVTGVYLDTLGLENNQVSDVAVAGAATQRFLQESFMTYATNNTIVKVGRQKLDTPLAFSEDWNIVENSFEAGVLINKDIKDTTLVAAYVSEGNGRSTAATSKYTINDQGAFTNYISAGARAVGAVNTSISDVTAQAWYYDVVDTAKAYWLQADGKIPSAPMGMTFGLQYANVDHVAKDATTGYAAKIAANVSDVNVYVAYSSVDSSNGLPLANTATTGKKTKLYTASIFSDGTVVAQPDVKAYKVGATTSVAGVKLGASYGSYDVGANGGASRVWATTLVEQTINEIDVSATAKLADVNVSLYYMNRTSDVTNNSYNHDTIRVIASLDF